MKDAGKEGKKEGNKRKFTASKKRAITLTPLLLKSYDSRRARDIFLSRCERMFETVNNESRRITDNQLEILLYAVLYSFALYALYFSSDARISILFMVSFVGQGVQ